MTLKTITFTHDAEIVNEGRVPRRYKAGETHTLRLDQAQRWIKRGMAVEAAPVEDARARMEALKATRAPSPRSTDMRPGPSPVKPASDASPESPAS